MSSDVVRTVREFEAAGIAGIHIEDQVTPKRCGLLPQGIPVVTCDEQTRIDTGCGRNAALGLDQSLRLEQRYLGPPPGAR